MRNIMVLIENNLRISILKRPLNFIMSISLPIIIVLIFAKMVSYSGGFIDVGVIDYDKSKTSSVLVENLKNSDNINIINTTEEKASEQLIQNDIDFLVSIESGFETNILNNTESNINIKTSKHNELYNTVTSSLNLEIENMKQLAYISEGDTNKYHALLGNYLNNETSINQNRLSDLSLDYENYRIFISFLIMIMFFKATAVAYNINLDKYSNVYTRMFISNVKTQEYYIANIISNLIVLSVQILISMAALKYGLDIQIGMEYSHLFIILLLVSLVAVSFANLCIAVTKDSSEAGMLSNIFSMLFIFCGGGFISVEILPEFMQKISYFTPIRWAMDSINHLQQGFQFSDIFKNLLILILFSVLFFVITAYKTSKDDKKFDIYG